MILTRRVAIVVVLAGLGCGLAFFIWFGLKAVRFAYPLDYGEGPLLDQAVRFTHGDVVYGIPGDTPPWTVSNYPPLFPLLEAGFSVAFGPAFWYGRLISVLSAVGSAVLSGLIIHRLTRDRLAAVVTGGLLLMVPYLGLWSALARVDSLALFWSLAGLWCVVAWGRQRAGLLAGVVLLATAVYTRQTELLAAPLAAFVWLWQFSRRRAFVMAGSLGLLMLVPAVVINVVTDGGFWFGLITANLNEYRWSTVVDFADYTMVHLPILVLAGVIYPIVGFRTHDGPAPLIVAYLAGAIVVALTIGKVGSSMNYLLELSTALCLCVGALLAALGKRTRLRLVGLAAVAAQVLLLLLSSADWYGVLIGRMNETQSVEELSRIVRDATGPVLADEDLGLLPLAGRPIELQPFEMSQLAHQGQWDQAALISSIDQHRYAAILIYYLPDYPVEQDRWTPEMLAAVHRSYPNKIEIPRSYGTTIVYTTNHG